MSRAGWFFIIHQNEIKTAYKRIIDDLQNIINNTDEIEKQKRKDYDIRYYYDDDNYYRFE